MSHPVARGAATDAPEHCAGCGVAVAATRHTRTDVMVGFYRLHGGSTEVTTLSLDDGATLEYRRLVQTVVTVACPRCFDSPAMRALWASWGEAPIPRSPARRGGDRP